MSQHFSWQAAVLASELESTTKLVLLVIGARMNMHGEGAFPSYATMARDASLNRATVIRHVEKALEEGWIIKQERFRAKPDTKIQQDTNLYQIAFPESYKEGGVAQNDQGWSHKATRVVAQNDQGSRTERPPLVAQSDPNTPSLTPQLTPQVTPLPTGYFDPSDAAAIPGPKDPTTKTHDTWQAYANAYHARYRTYPVWNRSNAGKISQIIERVGKDAAPGVAAFYVTLNDSFYVRKMHAVGNLLSDCEAIHTQWATGRTMTQRQAVETDRRQATGNMAANLADKLRAQGRMA